MLGRLFHRSPAVTYRNGAIDDPNGGPAIMFVHGFSGAPGGTWKKMMAACVADPTLNEFTLDCFGYPTKFIRIPFTGKSARIQQLSDGLKTELETRHRHRSEIILVGHSLGGLVIRQYVVNEIKAGRVPLANKVLLFAVPNTGASLAEVGSLFSWNHHHLKQLCRNSDILNILNDDWANLHVEDRINVRYVVGGGDAVVTPESARPYYGRDNISTLIGHDHRSIIQPENGTDIRYAILRNFIAAPQAEKIDERSTRVKEAHRPADVLFDAFEPQDDIYYVSRNKDEILNLAMRAGHTWLTGPSGVGKTTSLRRTVFAAGWKFHQIMLGGYQGRDPLGLLRAMCVELSAIYGDADQPVETADAGELVAYYRRKLRTGLDDNVVTILTEEIPLSPGADLNEFLRLILQLMLAIGSDPYLNGRVQLAFSSIEDFTGGAGNGLAKLHERIQFLKMHAWTPTELHQLIEMLSSILKPELTSAEKTAIASAANGSPRFVKVVFRRWRNGTAEGLSVQQLLESVRAELA